MAKGVNMTPLGQDRAYRRYWLFNSLPGLFVEDAEVNPGCCRPTPTPLRTPPFLDPSDPDHGPISALRDLFRAQARQNVEGRNEDRGSSDKENDGTTDGPGIGGRGAPLRDLPHTPNQNHTPAGSLSTGKEAQSHSKSPGGPQKTSEDKGATGGTKVDLGLISSIVQEVTSEASHSRVFGLCNADPKSCSVHARPPNVHRWFFFSQVSRSIFLHSS